MTSPLLRLYELMGAEVDHEAGVYRLSSTLQPNPVELVLKVMPTAIRSPYGRETVLSCTLLLRDERVVMSGYFEQYQHEVEVEIPVNQLRFFIDEKEA